MSEVSRGSMMIYRAVQLIKIFSTGPSSLKMFRNFPRKKDFFSSLVLSSHMDMDGAQLPCTEQLGENWSWSGVRSFISSSELLRPCHRTNAPTNQSALLSLVSQEHPKNLQCISWLRNPTFDAISLSTCTYVEAPVIVSSKTLKQTRYH